MHFACCEHAVPVIVGAVGMTNLTFGAPGSYPTFISNYFLPFSQFDAIHNLIRSLYVKILQFL